MKFKTLVTTILIYLVVCLPATAKDLINLEDFPKWFRDTMLKDTEVQQRSSLKIEQFGVDAQVVGKYKLQEHQDGYWYYIIEIGSETPVECYVFTEFDGAANSLYSVLEHSLTNIAALNKKSLTNRFNYAVDTGMVADTPYLKLDTLYILEENGQRVTGVVKGLSARTENSLQICLHNEIGYRDAFFAVFESYIQAFTANENNPEFFEPVFQFILNDMPVGYGREKYTTDQDGDVEISLESALLIPVDASSVARSDTVSTSWSRPDGTLINGNEFSVENGVLNSQFTIQKNEDTWEVHGQLQGKEVKVALEHKEGLLSNYGSYIAVAQLRAAEEESAGHYMWLAEADPTAAITVNISKIIDSKEANFELEMGPVVMQFLSDDKGIFRKGAIKHGPIEMKLELMFVNGTPVIP